MRLDLSRFHDSTGKNIANIAEMCNFFQLELSDASTLDQFSNKILRMNAHLVKKNRQKWIT